MLDERVAEVAPERRHLAFNNKTVGQRAAIVAAGPIANFLLAIVAYWLVFMIGVPALKANNCRYSPLTLSQNKQN